MIGFNERQQYTCPDCGRIGASSMNTPAPLCDRCDYMVTMRKSHNGRVIEHATEKELLYNIQDRLETDNVITKKYSNIRYCDRTRTIMYDVTFQKPNYVEARCTNQRTTVLSHKEYFKRKLSGKVYEDQD